MLHLRVVDKLHLGVVYPWAGNLVAQTFSNLGSERVRVMGKDNHIKTTCQKECIFMYFKSREWASLHIDLRDKRVYSRHPQAFLIQGCLYFRGWIRGAHCRM